MENTAPLVQPVGMIGYSPFRVAAIVALILAGQALGPAGAAAHRRGAPVAQPRATGPPALPSPPFAPTPSGATGAIAIQVRPEAGGPGADPRLRRLAIFVRDAATGAPVAGARVEIHGESLDGVGVHGSHGGWLVNMAAEAAPGEYRGSLSLPGGGRWLLRVRVDGPAQGTVEWLEDLGRTIVAGPRSGPMDLAVRGLHLTAAAFWLGGLGHLAALMVSRRRAMARGEAWDLPVSWPVLPRALFGGALAVLLVTGLYNVRFGTPTGDAGSWLGLLTLMDMPLGPEYLLALLVKVGLAILAFLLMLPALLGRAPFGSAHGGTAGPSAAGWNPRWLWVSLAAALAIFVLVGILNALHVWMESPGS